MALAIGRAEGDGLCNQVNASFCQRCGMQGSDATVAGTWRHRPGTQYGDDAHALCRVDRRPGQGDAIAQSGDLAGCTVFEQISEDIQLRMHR